MIVQSLEDCESALHRKKKVPSLYLAFTRNPNVPSGFCAKYARCAQGAFDHMELLIVINRRSYERVIVPRAHPEFPDALLFREERRPFKANLTWEYLRVPIDDEEQIGAISRSVTAMIERGDYFSERAMVSSGLPWIPGWLLRFFYPEPEREKGEPTFCSKMCLTALHAAGILEHVSEHTTSASALWRAARVNLKAFPKEFDLSLVTVDAAGEPLSSDHVLSA